MSEATVVDKRWTYCPECGSTEIRHAEGDHKQCACCLQEWFADIDYTDVVRTNLGNRMQLRSSLTARDEALASIRVFAQDCIENGYFDKGALGNLYSIRDLCDSKGEAK